MIKDLSIQFSLYPYARVLSNITTYVQYMYIIRNKYINNTFLKILHAWKVIFYLIKNMYIFQYIFVSFVNIWQLIHVKMLLQQR